MQCVQRGEAKPVIFKDFDYHGKVEREVWFEGPLGKQGFQYTIVHIHFNDAFDEIRHNDRQPQSTSVVTAVNVRHYTREASQDRSKAGFYKTIFEDIYLEEKGYSFWKSNKPSGWKWKQVPANTDVDRHVQQGLQIHNVPQYFDGDKQLQLEV
jgi:hypothetical protein